MYISAQLRATVRIQTDGYGPLVFEYDGENETNRIEMDSKELADRKVLSHHTRVPRGIVMVHGIVLYLEVEEICHPVSTCRFSTAQSIVDMISAGLIKTDTLLFILIGFFFFGALVVGVISKTGEPERSREREIVTARVWMPPADEENDSRIMNRSSRTVEENPCLLTTAQRSSDDDEMMEPIRGSELPAGTIPLHVEASGAGPIQSPITFESVNQVDSKYSRRVLHWLADNTNGMCEVAIKQEALRCLKARAEVDAQDCDENTALMLAVKARRLGLAQVLLKAKADPTIFNKAKRSALHEAVANTDIDLVTVLLKDPRVVRDINEFDRNGKTALMIAASSLGYHQVVIAKLLLAKGAILNEDDRTRKDAAYNGRSALHFAAMIGNIPLVKFLISMRTIIDEQDEDRRTPVMLAAREGHFEIVQYLVEHGASLTVVDADNKDASHHAQDGYHHELVKYLHDISLNTTRNEALRQATKNQGGRQTMKAVKRAGARKTPLTKDSNALTPPSSEASSCSSNPPPVFFHTNTSTPTFSEPSPDHRPGSDRSKHGPQ
uniref:ANK_REP_REGION domain-containing protein n=2 Tax=Caenorhabditis tropicalis TaxID=1561998 RepID=A0A1I7U4J2_9PELO